MRRFSIAIVVFAAIVGSAFAPKLSESQAQSKGKGKADATVSLTPAGEALRVRYDEMLKSLRAEIVKSLPKIDGAQKAGFEKAQATVKAASDERKKAQQNLGKIQQAQALVEHAKGKWIGGAEKGIAEAQKAMKAAKTDADRAKATADLAKWQQNKEDGMKALKERQANLDHLKADEAKLRQADRTAEAVLSKAQTAELAAVNQVMTDARLALTSESLDPKLIKAMVLIEATPAGLAQFAQQSKDHEALVDQLLNDTALMKEMLTAGGASKGKYGQAMQILTDIRKASPRSNKGILQRVAVATSLAHADPINQRNSENESASAAKTIDPVKRYLHYEKAYLDGELDPAFPSLTTWECRYVVDSYAPDAMLTWGREMLRNYRPDHISNPNYGWRYSEAVRTDVAYRHSNEYKDSEDLGFFQNVCKNGGICGRRAFFGRYIVQAFGLPARPFTQPKHAALARWTPAGWVVNLGASWPNGWFPEQTGPEFLIETQARKLPQEYQRVLRADWISSVVGEPKPTKKGASAGFWKQLAGHEEKAIIAKANPKELAALGTELAEANESDDAKSAPAFKAKVTEADRKIATGPNGAITIPAAALGGGNHLVNSYGGGLQMICSARPISASVDVPKAGKYTLTARVVTVHGEQTMPLTLNNAKTSVDVPIPFTIGAWQTTAPVQVSLTAGTNALNFARPNQTFALKDITLTPVK